MGIICPSCNHENLTRGEFCNNCSEPIWFECPRCQESYPAGAQYCSHCKYPVRVTPANERCPACNKVIPLGTTRCDCCQTSLTKPPVLQVTPTRLDLGKVCVVGEGISEVDGGSLYQRTYRFVSGGLLKKRVYDELVTPELLIANTGGKRLDVTIVYPDWIDEIRSSEIRRGSWGGCSGRIGGERLERCEVTLSGWRLRQGRHSGAITITSNGGNATVAVTVEVV